MSRRRYRVDIYLEPGQLGVYTVPTRVKTILGSCVVRQETDGEGGRKLLFDTPSGELTVRALSDRLRRGVCGGAR